VNATPVGKVPVSDSVATGVPVDVTEKVNFVPTVTEADAALVIFGATGAGATVIVNCCVAVPLAFFAVRVSDEVPTVVGMPEMVAVPFPLFVKVTPLGRVPDSVMVAAGEPVVVTEKVNAVPTVPVAEVELVKLGATGGAVTVKVNAWVTVPDAFRAVMVILAVPAAVGVPASVAVPLAPGVKVTPVGRVPVSESDAAGVPVDVTEKVKAFPTVAEKDAALVNVGGTAAAETAMDRVWLAVP